MTKQISDQERSAAQGGSTGGALTEGASTVGMPDGSVPGPAANHAALRYTTLRIALFLSAMLLLWGIAKVFNMDLSSQLSKLTLLAVAMLLSSAVSFVVLSKQRDAMSAGLVARSERLGKRFGEKFDDAASFEDEEEDE